MEQSVLYLSRRDVERVSLPMAEIIDAVEAVFREKAAGRLEMPPKIGIHTGSGGGALPLYIGSTLV